MAEVRPFKAIRPRKDIAHMVPSRTYVSYSRRELIATLQKDPYSFLHIINPEWYKKNRPKPNSLERFRKVKQRFEEFQDEGTLIEETQQSFYIYEQQDGPNTYIGIIGCSSVDDYLNGTIKVHEKTLEKRENLLKEYLKVCDLNAEPVLMTYPDDEGIDNILEQVREGSPEYDFTTQDDEIHHKLWTIDEKPTIDRIRQRFAQQNALYIADGHHRVSSSVLLAQEKREEKGAAFTGKEGFNFFMAYFIPESQLTIYGYHRAVKDLNGYAPDTFLKALEKEFEIEPVKEGPCIPSEVHRFGMYLNERWYELALKEHPDRDPVENLDASLLYHKVLHPLLGIQDPRKSERMVFAGGPDGIQEINTPGHRKKIEVAFILHPVTFEQLKAVADAGMTMPPKTTWIEPKLRSGLTVYCMDLDHDFA